jgi:hypothetical protein
VKRPSFCMRRHLQRLTVLVGVKCHAKALPQTNTEGMTRFKWTSRRGGKVRGKGWLVKGKRMRLSRQCVERYAQDKIRDAQIDTRARCRTPMATSRSFVPRCVMERAVFACVLSTVQTSAGNKCVAGCAVGCRPLAGHSPTGVRH